MPTNKKEYMKQYRIDNAARIKEQAREYNRKNREAVNERNRRTYHRKKEWFYTLKTPCIVCGESEPVAIDFHHTGEDDKFGDATWMRGQNKQTIMEEVAKCVCLCANCHRKVHAGLISLDI